MLCDLVSRKNNKLWILQLFWKTIHKKELSRTKFYGFQAKLASYGHNHGIVCSNDPILCTCVHLWMENNVDLGCSPFLGKKSPFFILLAPKWVFFVKEVQKVHIKIVPSQFYKISYLISCTKDQLFVCPNISIHLSQRR
jgi:hypothetical protein